MFNVSNIKVYFQIARRQHYTAEKSKPVFPGFMLFLALVCQNCTFWRWENGTKQDSSVHLQLQTIRLLQSYSNQGLKHWRGNISATQNIIVWNVWIWFFHLLVIKQYKNAIFRSDFYLQPFHSSIFTLIFSLTTLIWLSNQKAQRTVMCSTQG